MKKLASLYIIWGIILCLHMCFIFRDGTHMVEYTRQCIAPSDVQEFSVPLVTKPDVYEPDTLTNIRTGEVLEVAYGQAVKKFWHTDSFHSLPWGMRLAGAVCGMASLLLILCPYGWSYTLFKNIEAGNFFTADNERLLRRFGYCQLAGVALLAVFHLIDFLGLRMQLDFEHYHVGFEWFSLLAYAIPPACFLFAAEAFRIGNKLQKDTEGLV